MTRLVLILDMLVSAIAAVLLGQRAIDRWSAGAYPAAALAALSAILLLVTAGLLLLRRAGAAVTALLALITMAAFALLQGYQGGTINALLDGADSGTYQDLLRTIVPLAFYAWIVADLFKARRIGALT